MSDLLFALRQLRKAPGFAFVAILTLALGIGANTSIFSVVNAVLLRPLPYPHSERLMVVSQRDADQPAISMSFPDYLDYRRDNTVFEHLAVARRQSYNLSGLRGREPEQLAGAVVTANFFNAVGLSPQIGRTFSETEDRVGGPMLAVISDRLWQKIFQREPSVLGRTLTFNNQPYTVIGVMPPQMFSPRLVDVWFPLIRTTPDDPGFMSRENHPGLFGWGRLKAGVSQEKAQSELNAIATRLEKLYQESNSQIGANVQPLLENQVGHYRSSLTLLFCAVTVVLLIACANLANLLAARGAARAREFAIRVAIGASRWKIVRQVLVESLVLAVLGGALGLFLAAWGRDLLVALSPANVRRFQETSIDNFVFIFTALLAIITTLLFGLWPAWHMSRADTQTALKAGSHGSSDSRGAKRSRELLIIFQVALTLILLSAAALVLKSFANATSLDLGFEPRKLATAVVDLPSPEYDKFEKLRPFCDGLLAKLRALPGVEHAAIAANPPMMTGWQTGFLAEGQAEPPPGQLRSMEMAVISEDYFATLQTPILRGRTFTSQDTNNSPPVIIIDQTTADRFFPGQNPIGKRIRMQTDNEGKKMREIVGVVPRLKVYGFNETNALPQGYLPQGQIPNTNLVILLRTTASAKSLERSLRQIVASLDPAQAVSDIQSMEERVAETWAAPRLLTVLLSGFAALALILAIIGIYGVMAYNGLRRMREIGVRLALGARRQQIIAMMLQQGVRLLGVGLALGFAGAAATSRVLRSLLFQVSASDPLVYVVVTALLAAAAVAACWLPARRASRVDPVITLRSE